MGISAWRCHPHLWQVTKARKLGSLVYKPNDPVSPGRMDVIAVLPALQVTALSATISWGLISLAGLGRLTMNESEMPGFRGLLANVCAGCGPDLKIHSAHERACCTISTKTLRVSAGLLTSRKNAMRAPRLPSWVFKRT
jgi:hypothetical protein